MPSMTLTEFEEQLQALVDKALRAGIDAECIGEALSQEESRVESAEHVELLA